MNLLSMTDKNWIEKLKCHVIIGFFKKIQNRLCHGNAVSLCKNIYHEDSSSYVTIRLPNGTRGRKFLKKICGQENFQQPIFIKNESDKSKNKQNIIFSLCQINNTVVLKTFESHSQIFIKSDSMIQVKSFKIKLIRDTLGQVISTFFLFGNKCND